MQVHLEAVILIKKHRCLPSLRGGSQKILTLQCVCGGEGLKNPHFAMWGWGCPKKSSLGNVNVKDTAFCFLTYV